jgi:hypothetical protein
MPPLPQVHSVRDLGKAGRGFSLWVIWPLVCLLGATVLNAGAPGDFDGDGKSDLLLTNAATGERALWLMNGASIGTGAHLGVLPVTWTFAGTGDFDGDGKADVALHDSANGEAAIWLMNGTGIAAKTSLGLVAPDWSISGAGDFNGDGRSDLVLTNTVTGERALWLMNGARIATGVVLGAVSTDWVISGAGDFDGDGRCDLILTNSVTAQRALWLMNGNGIVAGVPLGILSTAWTIAGLGDFNADGRSDVLLTNTITGDRAVWLMSGTGIMRGVVLGRVSPDWSISAVGDFDGDGAADIFLTNTITGDRAIWLMHGTSIGTGAQLGVVPLIWQAAPAVTPPTARVGSNGLGLSWQLYYFGHAAADPEADPDGDALTNRQEFLRGTSPTNADTDGDGLPDGLELSVGTDPLARDAAVVPTKIAGLRLLLQADAGITTTVSGAVGRWADNSGRANDATQLDAAHQPAWVAGAINGRPVVRFESESAQWLNLPNMMNGATQGEIFIVARVKDFANPANGLAHFGVGGGTVYGIGEVRDDFGIGDGDSYDPPSAAVLLRPHLYNSSVTTGGLSVLRFNQAELLQRSGQSVIFRPDPILGADWQGDYLNGDLAEVVVYDRALSSVERDAVATYLAEKYCLQGPTTLEAPALRVMAASATTVALSWNGPSTGQYVTTVERRAGNGAWTVLSVADNATSQADPGLTAGAAYSYRVKNANFAGESPYSGVATITLPTTGRMPMTGLRLWLRADAGVVVDESGSVSVWLDQTGSHPDAVQSRKSSRPQWVPAAANGRPVIRFDGADDRFDLPDVMADATAGEILVVARLRDSSNPYNGLLHFGTGYGTVYGDDGEVWDDFGTASLDPLSGPGVALLTQVHLYDSSISAEGEAVLRFNGMESWRRAAQGVTFRPDPLIGADRLGEFFMGDVAEVLVYDRVLTAEERLMASAELNDRYAVVAAPDAPVILAATAVSPTRVILAWSQPGLTPATSYIVERKTGPEGTYTVIATLTGVMTYADAELVSGGIYLYRVKAGYVFGSGPYSADAKVATLLDSDGDGVSDADELVRHTDPQDYYDGQPPVLTVLSGDAQVGAPGRYLDEPVVVRATRANGAALVNAPLVFDLVNGAGGIALVRGAAARSSVALRTDGQGVAQVFLQLSAPAADDVLRVRPDSPSGDPVFVVVDPPAPLAYVTIPLRPADGSSAASLMPRKVTESGRVLLSNQAVTPYEFGMADTSNTFHRAGYSLPAAVGYRWGAGRLEPLRLRPVWQPPEQVVELTDEGFTYGYLHTTGLIGVTDMNDSGDVIGFVGTNFAPLADSSDLIYFRQPACWPVHVADALALPIGDANPAYRTEGLIRVDYDGLQQSYRAPARLDLKAIADNGAIFASFTDPGLSVPGHLIPDQDQHQGTYSWSSSASVPVLSENRLTLAVSPDGSQAVTSVQDPVPYAFPIHSRAFPYEIIDSVGLYRYSAPTCQVNGMVTPYSVTGPINNGGRYLTGASWAESGRPLQPVPGLDGGAALALNDRNDILGQKADGSVGLWAWRPLTPRDAASPKGFYLELGKRFDLPAGWQVRDLAPSFNDSRMLAGRIAQTQDGSGNTIPAAQQAVVPVLFVPASVSADVNHFGLIRPDRESSRVTPTTPVLSIVNGASANRSAVSMEDLPFLVPLVLDLKGLLAALPPGSGYSYKLKQADSALNFIYTSLAPAGAAGFRDGGLTTGFGRTLDQTLVGAAPEPITAEGATLTGLFLDLIKRQGAGVILLESRQSSTAPLIVEVGGPDGVVCQIALPINSVQAELAVDANHDGRIKLANEDPGDATSPGRPYRSWLNDDDDLHAPGPLQRPDYSTAQVDGEKDLEDFFPVFLNLQQLVKALPPGASIKYKLRQADGAVNFVETGLTRETAFTYQSATHSDGFGAALAEPAASATTQQVTPAGVELSTLFLNNIRDHDQGVILIEGRTPSTRPLVLTVEKEGVPAAEISLPLSLGARILLLLHGMNSNPATWDIFRAAEFGGSSTDMFDGKIYPPVTGTPPRPTARGVHCYRLKFGAVETSATTREGLEHLTTTTAEGYLGPTPLPYLNIDIRCGDFETFDELGREVGTTVTALLDRYPNAQIVLLGHSRGGLAARAFLEGNSPGKSAVIGLLTTSTPHLGSRLAQIYHWLADHPRPAGPLDADWQVVEFLRHPTVTIAGFTLAEKETLDVRRPVIGDVASGPHISSAALTALNAPAAVANLPANIRYGEIVYQKAPLGLMTVSPPSLVRYTVFDEAGTANPFDQLSVAAATYILGPNNTPASFPGDGLIPAGDQVFTQLAGFPVSSSATQSNTINRLIVTDPEVVHEGAPSRTDDMLAQLRLLAPGWFSPTNP